jgi:hypothetical protein
LLYPDGYLFFIWGARWTINIFAWFWHHLIHMQPCDKLDA